MERSFRKCLISVLLWLGCHAVIVAFWRSLEITEYGEVRPSDIDTIISVLFSLSLWRNVRNWFHFRN